MSEANNDSNASFEQTSVELPAYALENMDTHLGQLSGHTGGQGGITESLGFISGALAARDLTFPCVRRTMWGDQLIVKVVKRKTPTHKPA
jgi:hypothetical protein